jgi:hypothetical protein
MKTVNWILLRKIICLPTVFLVFLSPAWAQGSEPVYDSTSFNQAISFDYSGTGAESRELRQRYQLDTLLSGKNNDVQKVLSVLSWVHQQWRHDGSNEPSRPDALTILREAREGKNFRCVEYATVLTGALNALGFQARVVGLKTRDCETKKSGAGHVLTEVWLPEFEKWVLVDGQFNVVPFLGGVPLNAVELQRALSGKSALKPLDKAGEVEGPKKMYYRFFIQPYLYYLETPLTHLVEKGANERAKPLTHVMLVPLGAKPPTVFQQTFLIDYAHYTNSIQDFYRRPN